MRKPTLKEWMANAQLDFDVPAIWREYGLRCPVCAAWHEYDDMTQTLRGGEMRMAKINKLEEKRIVEKAAHNPLVPSTAQERIRTLRLWNVLNNIVELWSLEAAESDIADAIKRAKTVLNNTYPATADGLSDEERTK